LFDEFNANARQRGRVLRFQNIHYGYMRVEPRHGVDYMLDMVLWFKKIRPPHSVTSRDLHIIESVTSRDLRIIESVTSRDLRLLKALLHETYVLLKASRDLRIIESVKIIATLSVRRHAYVQQTFGSLEIISDDFFRDTLRQRIAKSIRLWKETNKTKDYNWQQIKLPPEKFHVHMILPLAGRVDSFRRFANNLRTVCLNRRIFSLILVIYDSVPDMDAAIAALIDELKLEIDIRVRFSFFSTLSV
ncbi:unnamed protein product, partial [Onchocerca ochengi]|uniref:Hexosyltransferase n=1 Tax=Onchocerca ochengi TaxID=42157 RepID=A0A182EVE5_ONCOC